MPLRVTPRRRPRSGRTHRDDIALQPGAGAQRAVHRHAARRAPAQRRGRSRGRGRPVGAAPEPRRAGRPARCRGRRRLLRRRALRHEARGWRPTRCPCSPVRWRSTSARSSSWASSSWCSPARRGWTAPPSALAILVVRAGLAGLPGGRLPADAPARLRRAVRRAVPAAGCRDRRRRGRLRRPLDVHRRERR